MLTRCRFGSLSLFVLFCLSGTVSAQSDAAPAKRRVFVLHSGMHILLAPKDKNQAVITLKRLLPDYGIEERDIVGLDCPFPTASWINPFPREGLLLYLGSSDPAGQVCQEAYLRLDRALQAQGVSSKDDLVWIGHSAGGQLGMSLAHLAHHLDRFPELARKARPYHFDMVVTLGSAVGSNPVPAEVKLRHYYSPADMVIGLLTKHTNLLSDTVGVKVRFAPCHDVRGNGKVRVFDAIEHGDWFWEPRVLECLLREFRPAASPVWRRAPADLSTGIGLSQVLATALEATWQISLEEVRP
jgi:hypothetical protein